MLVRGPISLTCTTKLPTSIGRRGHYIHIVGGWRSVTDLMFVRVAPSFGVNAHCAIYVYLNIDDTYTA